MHEQFDHDPLILHDPKIHIMSHTCHWTGCKRSVPPKLWGCKQHWYALPKHLRDRIWATYRPGQEITKTPSDAYLEAAREVQKWIKEHGGSRLTARERYGSQQQPASLFDTG